MRILYLGDLAFGGTCLMRLEAMRSMGHDVTAVDMYRHDLSGLSLLAYKVAYHLRRQIDFTRANEQIKQLCREKPFELVWIDKGNTLRPATLADVRRQRPQAVIAGYSPDDMAAKHNNTVNFVRSLAFHDVYFTTKTYGVAELAALGCPRVVFNGNAYDEAIHRPMTLEGPDVEKFSADLGFIGSYEQDRAEQMLFLDQQGFPVRIHGSMWDEFPQVKELSIPPRAPVFNEDYTKAVCGAKINLCFLRKMNRDLQTQRSVEIPACGAFMLAERTDEHRELFEEGKEAEFFSSKQELVEKVRHYLAHPDERRRIADAGRERCLRSGYSYHDRIRQMLAEVAEIARAKELTTKELVDR
jgi:spore maturation protein CgeB